MADSQQATERDQDLEPQEQELSSDTMLSELQRRYDELTHSQKRIAEVIVEDPEFVAFATVDKLAARLGISPSTVVRFAYRLGLDGFPGLQARAREAVRPQLRRQMRSGGAPELAAHLDNDIYKRSLVNDVEILERTIQRLDSTLLDRAIEQLVQARRVWVCGGATSLSVAQFASTGLARVRPDVTLLAPDERAVATMLDTASEDVLLAFTFPFYAKRTLEIVEWVKSRDVFVIGITDSAISPLSGNADVLLPVTPTGIGTQNSLVAAMAVANVLVNGVSDRLPDSLERYSQIMRHVRGLDVFLLDPHDDSRD